MKFTAFIWDHSLSMIRRDNITSKELAPHLGFEFATDKPLYPGKIKVGEVDIEIELLPSEQIVAGAALALRQRAKEVRRKASEEASQLEAKAEQLLAIENKPTLNLNKEKA